MEIIEKWAAENPKKTRQSEFLKMFPNAPFIKNESVVDIAPCSIDTEYKKECGHFNSCFECKKEYWLEDDGIKRR